MHRLVLFLLIPLLCAACSTPVARLPPATPSLQQEPTSVPATATSLPTVISASATPAATDVPATATPQSHAARLFYTRFDETNLRGTISSMKPDGSDEREIAACEGRCSFAGFDLTPDRSQIAFVTDYADRHSTLRVVDVTSGEERWMIEHFFQIYLVGFSPDGSTLAYALGNESEIFGLNGTLWLRDVDGSTRSLSDAIHPLGIVDWLDDDHLIWSISDGLSQVGTITRLAIAPGSQPEPLIEGTLRSLSPDRRLALIGTEAIGHDIVAAQRFAHQIVDITTQPPRVLQSFAWTVGNATWSPSSTKIVHTGSNGLALFRVADGSIETLKQWSTKSVSVPNMSIWSEDERSLFYTTNTYSDQPQTHIWRQSLDTGDEERLISLPGGYNTLLALK